ncbi:ABC transporter ATP-binding protein [Desulfosporosinus sp.]|uniref:ABC transporter ATP-binding protein n=1 Tax=Desulfosporosinus sp. TaxID=157907 RepID=UPI002612CCBD|nr:ABC transporter ATP-binding protein [Desulfosporosinus sp.]MCO5385276.1 ABC transporter ATP-binding protein [Desulfosporosinus sp.]
MSQPVLKVENLYTSFRTPSGIIQAVRGISFTLNAGQVLGIVGESGCGKSVTANSIMGLSRGSKAEVKGRVLLNGQSLLDKSNAQLRRFRGKEMALICQNPMNSLNPVRKIGSQFIETILCHRDVSKDEARRLAVEFLGRVALPDSGGILKKYPFQLSGGMLQRVMIAMALALNPSLIIADEPTTALDVIVQSQILLELHRLKREYQTGILMISHDLGVVASIADEVGVMYAGKIIEQGPVETIFFNPAHPYTIALLNSRPRKDGNRWTIKLLGGQPPLAYEANTGCAFAPRCNRVSEMCCQAAPDLNTNDDKHFVACHYPDRQDFRNREEVAGAACS